MPDPPDRPRHKQPQKQRSPLRVLAVTRLFPNRVEPFACAFQRQQLGALARRCSVEVLAAIPTVAGASLLGDRTRVGRLTRVPSRDEIEGIPVLHPRVPYLPGVSALPVLAPLNAPLYLAGLLPHLPRLRGRFDVVLGAFLYPDACAAAALSRALGLPYAIKTHGTDVNVVAGWPSLRPMIARALRGAAFSIGVSRPMVDALVRLGAPPERTVLIANGVDRGLFRPRDPCCARRAAGLPDNGLIVLFVGLLDKDKGLRELCAAFEAIQRARPLPSPVHLVLVGEGAMGRELAAQAARHVAGPGQMILAGPRSLAEVARYLGASDVLALPSYHEGTPNVVLEALAAGRPVVATRVGGIPDVITHGATGLLIPAKDVAALTDALVEALSRPWDPELLRASAPPSWAESAGALYDVLAAAAWGAPLEAA